MQKKNFDVSHSDSFGPDLVFPADNRDQSECLQLVSPTDADWIGRFDRPNCGLGHFDILFDRARTGSDRNWTGLAPTCSR